jgi:dUTP pyrophosphatase
VTTVRFVRLAHAEGLPPPAPQSREAAGCDLMAALPESAPRRMKPGERALIPTGLTIELPEGFEAQVRPRSGLALKHGVTVLNAPGTIDSDYRGEIGVLLINLGHEPYVVVRGARVAQLVVSRVESAVFVEARDLKGTDRGEKGFGSTDIRRPQIQEYDI